MVFALAGNQNCGKTTLFNQLTGSNQHVGNFRASQWTKKRASSADIIPANTATVPAAGAIPKTPAPAVCEMATVVDLPGIYSLSPYTSEEIVTRDFLIKGKARMVSSTSWTPPTSSATFTSPCSSSS